MESNIVQDFQNLRVFSNRNVNRMDELVKDLNNALEESSKGGSGAHGSNCQENSLSSGGGAAVARRYHKRRRGARRASGNLLYEKKRCTISEASESSVDEAVRDYVDNSVVTHSDSDDLALAYPKQRLVVPPPVSEPVPPVESDSFTENLSPMRPQRRRRRYKHMAVDSLQTISRPDATAGSGGGGGESGAERSRTPTTATASSREAGGAAVTEKKRSPHHVHDVHSVVPGGRERGAIHDLVPGKRKRCSKSRSEAPTKDHRHDDAKDRGDHGDPDNGDNMDVASLSQ